MAKRDKHPFQDKAFIETHANQSSKRQKDFFVEKDKCNFQKMSKETIEKRNTKRRPTNMRKTVDDWDKQFEKFRELNV